MSPLSPTAVTPASPASRLGYWAALLTFVLTLGTFVVAILTPPFSGPLCTADCFSYPFEGIANRAPRDYLWMYPALVLNLVIIVLFAALHSRTSPPMQVFSHLALVFALLGAGILLVDYYTQIASVMPSTVMGESEGIALFTQFNAHGLFIALEDLGYFLMGVTFLFAAVVFRGANWLERYLRWLLMAAGIALVGGWVVFYAIHGYRMEYRFEIFSISVAWFTLILATLPLSVWFRRAPSAGPV